MFTYPMAAFARRIATNPTAFSAEYQSDAIRFTTAVMETYSSFRPDMWLVTNDPWGYYTLPQSYTTLRCTYGVTQCPGYKANAGQPLSWNENLSFMKALAEVAIAADSQLYRSSPDSPAKQFALNHATSEVPRLIAKNVKFFIDHLNTHTVTWSDGAIGYVWNHEYHAPKKPQIQNTPHAQFEIDSLAAIYELRGDLDGILARAGASERVAATVTSTVLARLATTLLRKMWIYDYSHNEPRNMLAGRVDGTSDIGADGKPVYKNAGCFVPLAQVDPWVWTRCRDVISKSPGYWSEEGFATLLLYR